MNKLLVDVKYAGLLSNQLDRWKLRSSHPYSANFRCPICGDSKRSKSKARGYLFPSNIQLVYKCHNCGVSMSFGKFLESVNGMLFSQYKIERYREGNENTIYNETRAVKEPEREGELLEKMLPKLSDLPEEHPAVQYCLNRKLPMKVLSRLYLIDDMRKIEQLSDSYKNKIQNEDPRILIPFRDRRGMLTGVTCRTYNEREKLRYMSYRVVSDPSIQMIYNLDRVDISRTVFCFEGPFDSMFFQNAIAIGSSDLGSIRGVIPKYNLVLVFDNQPKNNEIVELMNKASREGFNVCVWPTTYEAHGKDINEMILSGVSIEEITTTINRCTTHGLALKASISQWRKC